MTTSQQVFNQNKEGQSNLLVISVGLMRTGTNSQMKALEILLGGRCYHMDYILYENRHHLKLWYQAATRGLTRELADKIFSGFRASTDFPAALFYKELFKLYPNAKFVLSVRDPKRWANSMTITIIRLAKVIRMALPPVRYLVGLRYISALGDLLFESRLGFGLDATERELISAFDRHTENVLRVIPRDQLLVFRVSDGWEPLCRFLDLPVPDAPFPRVNDTAEFRKKSQIIFVGSIVLNTVFCAACGSVVWLGAKYCLERWG